MSRVAEARQIVLERGRQRAEPEGPPPPSDRDAPLCTPVVEPEEGRRLLTLREWYEHPELLVEPEGVLPYGLARKGRTTLLSSREKIGKTTLIAHALTELSKGGHFLDTQLTSRRTLFYQIDEPIGDTIRRFQQLGPDPDRIIVSEDRPTPDEMYDEILATGAENVVVDTLTELWRGLVRSASDSEEISVFARPYIDVARKTGASLVLLHHTTKAGSEYRGGVQLGAVVDVPLTFRRPNVPVDTDPGGEWDEDASDDGRRLLRGVGRGVKVDLRLTFDGIRYSLGVEPMSLRYRILRELNRNPVSGNVLAENLGKQKAAVLAEIRHLKDAGEVVQDGRLNKLTPFGTMALEREATGSTAVPEAPTRGFGWRPSN